MSGVVTVTLNPAIDVTAGLDALVPGAVNRVAAAQSDPGGKGVNVAGFLAPFGVRLAATGFLGRDNEAPFRNMLATCGIVDRFVRVEGATRSNIKIVEGEGARVTDLNFPGFAAGEGDEQALAGELDALAGAYGWVAFCGSLPRGASATLLPGLIARARARGARVALDSSGPALAAALAAGPDIIKPNGEELGEALGRRIATVPEAAAAAAEMRARGIGTVIVSLGAAGAVFAAADGVVHAVGRAATIRSTVGAGDALLAGTLLGTLRGLDAEGRARLATGFSLGALSMLGPHLPPPATIDALAASVSVTSLPA